MKIFGFGTMRLPTLPDGTIDQEQFRQMVDLFLSRGYTYFDTAYPYHQGKSEVAVRECLVKRYPREHFQLADKLPPWNIRTAADVASIFQKQLDKCGVEYFDYYLLHNVSTDTNRTFESCNCYEFLKTIKADGRAKHIGFSLHDKPELLDQILTEHPEMDFVQLQINCLDWDDPTVQARRCYEIARKHGKPILVMEPLKGGGLANLPPAAQEELDKLPNPDTGVHYGLRYCAGLEGVLMILSGMSDLKQMQQNLDLMDHCPPLTEQEHAALTRAMQIMRQSGAIACTTCRYCENTCPKDIAIPELFSAYNNVKQFGGRNFPDMFYRVYTKDRAKASECIACGQCMTHCPQHLEIPKLMKLVAAASEKKQA